MSTSLSWLNELPQDLKEQILQIQKTCPESAPVFEGLHVYFRNELDAAEEKRRKISPGLDEGTPATSDPSSSNSGAISPHEVIFELNQISFQSPMRKKMNMTFHLRIDENNKPTPVLLIVHPSTSIPEYSIENLSQLVKLCVLLPILGNSTNQTKRNIGLLCFWLNEEYVDQSYKGDPIICQLNFDTLKKYLIKSGKIPAEAESQLNEGLTEESNDGIKAISEAIISFFQRQFELCGIHLINYMPSSNPVHNKLTVNTDSGIALSLKADDTNNLLQVEAYKGAREGALLFLSANEFNRPFIIFGFKKPILVFEISKIKHISYSNITRLTFSITITYENAKRDSKVETVEFGMIDQQYFQIIDSFIKDQNINDDSFNSELREKGAHEGVASNVEEPKATADSDDEEEDGTFQLGVEQEEVDEEYDSNAASGSEKDVEESPSNDTAVKVEDVKNDENSQS